MSSKRIKYIDMLKAFCIILVMAGHMGYTPAKVKLLLYIKQGLLGENKIQLVQETI